MVAFQLCDRLEPEKGISLPGEPVLAAASAWQRRRRHVSSCPVNKRNLSDYSPMSILQPGRATPTGKATANAGLPSITPQSPYETNNTVKVEKQTYHMRTFVPKWKSN